MSSRIISYQLYDVYKEYIYTIIISKEDLIVTKFKQYVDVYSRGDAGGLSREYVLRNPSVSYKATKWGAVT